MVCCSRRWSTRPAWRSQAGPERKPTACSPTHTATSASLSCASKCPPSAWPWRRRRSTGPCAFAPRWKNSPRFMNWPFSTTIFGQPWEFTRTTRVWPSPAWMICCAWGVCPGWWRWAKAGSTITGLLGAVWPTWPGSATASGCTSRPRGAWQSPWSSTPAVPLPIPWPCCARLARTARRAAQAGCSTALPKLPRWRVRRWTWAFISRFPGY